MSYKVKLEVFEGPLDLLLYLIKKNEIDIYDIPIAVVLAGGYAFREEDTVDIHYNTIMTGLELFYG